MSDEISCDNLIYYFEGLSPPVSFIKYEDPSDIYDKLKNGDKRIQAAEEEQKKCNSKLGEMTSGNPEHKSKDQSDTIKNVQNLYNSRQKIIYLFIDSAKIRSEAIYEAKQDETKGTGLKILTLKQLLQRLRRALAQVKASKNSENLLNEIRHCLFFVSIKRNHSKSIQ